MSPTFDQGKVPPEPIAIIGTGCKFAGSSSSPSRLWELLSKPRDVASRPPANRFNIDAYYHPDGGNHGTTSTTESYFMSEDIGSFDASFFNISAAEAKILDPQQRLLLETVYESLEAAGLRLEALQGSRTGVFCGVMSADWEQILTLDNKVIPPYAATGMARNNLANRVSYFFDWTGPSMSIDTACSASLVAVHQAVAALHQGQCTLAAAVGVNLLLSPITYISTTKMQMLSPNGRSRMWDDKADGYARGEGIASVILKRLSDAISDGDPIECIIRATGVNQDGRSMGLTMPSSAAQLQLIESTYALAGLDPVNRPEDRCQYFEAHGTGTQAGDPQEASAIYNAFFPADSGADVLHVGSIKTVVGHTEGTAGLAGLIKASLCIKHGVIPPNLHFDNLNPKLEPFSSRLKVPTEPIPWPKLASGVPRRVSVNSFGFGGTNAHVIVESHETYLNGGLMSSKGHENGTSDSISNAMPIPAVLPFAFSSASERVLGAVLKQYASYLDANPDVDLINLAWSLMHRRSALTHRVTLWAPTVAELRSEIQAELDRRTTNTASTVITHPKTTRKRILGIFTGQGAQWAKMGHDLVGASPDARRWFEEMQASLDELPAQYRPPFSLIEELSRPKESSRLHEAALSQPLCTALQIVFVNLVASLGVTFDYVVGHSSGEIAAAYAAGFLTARDAIRIAYLRGQVASYAGSNGQPGAMLATALSMKDATAICAQQEFAGRITVAACNSPDSVTISGDANAIQELEAQLKGDNKFARLLRVDTAYHSHHMKPCTEPYLRAMEECDIRVASGNSTVWFSSVNEGKRVSYLHHAKVLAGDYWKDNMVSTVWFSQALEAAITAEDSVPYLAVEVGPHPALKGPAQQTITAALSTTTDIPYIGLSNRGGSGIGAFASGIGCFWAHLGPDAIKTERYVKLFDRRSKPSFIKNLPCYPFDHSQSYWYGTRRSRACLRRGDPPRTLLGTLSEDMIEGEWCWRNYLRPEELGWVGGHCIQSQTVFPATGYIAMALEAGHVAMGEQIPSLVHLYDFTIEQAISFNSNEPNGIETFVRIDQIRHDSDKTSARFTCHANIGGSLKTCASAQLSITLGLPSMNILPSCPSPVPGMLRIGVDEFYLSLSEKGYNYSGAFRELQSVERKLNFSRGTMLYPSILRPKCDLQLHPAVMDAALQVLLGAVEYPGDGELRTTMVPTRFEKVTISTYFCGRLGAFADQGALVFDAAVTQRDAKALVGDAAMFVPGGHGVFQFEGVQVTELTPRTEADDVQMFLEVAWGPLNPDMNAPHRPISETWVAELPLMEEMIFLFMKEIIEQVTPEDRAKLTGVRLRAVAWFDHVMSQVREGTHPFFPQGWINKTSNDLPALIARVTRTPDFDALDAVRNNLLSILLGETTLLEVMRKDNLLRLHYEKEVEQNFMNDRVADMVEQIVFRYQHMKILEIGAGTASATRRVINRIGRSYHSYTFTDISAAFFEDAQSTFAEHRDRFSYKTLDIEQDPMEQGFEERGYDLIIAANVLHATKNMRSTMSRVRRLLKPGGYLVALEYTNGDVLRVAFHTCGFEGWWVGGDEGRIYGPAVSVPEWQSILQDTGFSGIDAITETNHPLSAFSVFVSQAMDDRVQRLREPLALPHPAPETKSQYEDLILVGGETGRTARLADELQTILSPYFRRITRAHAIEVLDTKDIWLATALILTEIDSTFFKGLTEKKLSGFKALVAASYRLLWVTAGSEAGNPHLSMSKGFLNCMTFENQPSLYQYFNIVDPSAVDPSLLATSLMRMAHADIDNDYTFSACVWSTELEIRLEDGIMKIPRVLFEKSPNARYAATKRPVRMQLDLQQSSARVIQSSNRHFDLIEDTPRSKGVDTNGSPAKVELLVRYSTSSALRVRDAGYLTLVIGEHPETHSRYLAMSDKHASRISVPSSWCQQLPCDTPEGREPAFLKAAASILQAIDLVAQVSPNGVLLVHEADAILRSAIWTQAIAKGVKAYFTTSKKGIKASTPRTMYIHQNSSARALRALLPKHVSALVNLDETADSALSRAAPPSWEDAVKLDVDRFYRASAMLSGKQNVVQIPGALKIVCVMAAQLVDYRHKVAVSNVGELHEQPTSTDSLAIFDWTQSSQLSVLVQPASSQVELSPNKTYLLIGLTNDLGQSLCQWMVSRGARNIVLTSRNPKVSPQWVEMMLGLGARVIPMSM